MKVARAIAKMLKAEGVEFLIGYPVNPIIEAAAVEGIRTIIVRQERIGLHMCDAVSRTTSGERIGVFAMQHGLGTENAFGGVAQCYADNSPVLYLPTGYPRSQLDVAPNFVAGRNLRQVTKWGETVVDPERLPWMMQHAFAELRSGRPGPVLVETPIDLLNAEIDSDLTAYRPSRRSAPHPESELGGTRDRADGVCDSQPGWRNPLPAEAVRSA